MASIVVSERTITATTATATTVATQAASLTTATHIAGVTEGCATKAMAFCKAPAVRFETRPRQFYCHDCDSDLLGALAALRPLGRGSTRRTAGANGIEQPATLGMVEGVELLPAKGAWTKLLSARRHGNYLFLRYGFRES